MNTLSNEEIKACIFKLEMMAFLMQTGRVEMADHNFQEVLTILHNSLPKEEEAA